ncbi:hypothetical protein GCM10023116_20970 [Kistimonas scapharcae]|uniref:Uncharacterized protein n=1 Tax=Kistimonas scapharcae TaxID=1036133 RepID=A0ABP8V207_9GAMM
MFAKVPAMAIQPHSDKTLISIASPAPLSPVVEVPWFQKVVGQSIHQPQSVLDDLRISKPPFTDLGVANEIENVAEIVAFGIEAGWLPETDIQELIDAAIGSKEQVDSATAIFNRILASIGQFLQTFRQEIVARLPASSQSSEKYDSYIADEMSLELTITTGKNGFYGYNDEKLALRLNDECHTGVLFVDIATFKNHQLADAVSLFSLILADMGLFLHMREYIEGMAYCEYFEILGSLSESDCQIIDKQIDESTDDESFSDWLHQNYEYLAEVLDFELGCNWCIEDFASYFRYFLNYRRHPEYKGLYEAMSEIERILSTTTADSSFEKEIIAFIQAALFIIQDTYSDNTSDLWESASDKSIFDGRVIAHNYSNDHEFLSSLNENNHSDGEGASLILSLRKETLGLLKNITLSEILFARLTALLSED